MGAGAVPAPVIWVETRSMTSLTPRIVRLSRRRALAVFGTAGLSGLVAACGGDDDDGENGDSGSATTTAGDSGSSSGTNGLVDASALAGRFEDAATCSLTPEETEGPYYIDVDSIRSDVREDQDGVALALGIRVLDESCEPISDAVVEIWHCNALGIYSGFEAQSQGQGGPGGGSPGDDTRYLRGGQITDANGIVAFTTVYPGWYQGRTVHIHAKAHINNSEVLTTQLYFDDDLSDQVYEQAPYSEHAGRQTFNDNDGLFLPETVVTVTDEAPEYLALMTFTVNRG